jgi:DhnA family fructose-bisphosphate aldolase class Ia
MQTGKKLRLRRLLRDGRAVIVPMDHPVFFGPVPELRSPSRLVAQVAAAGADGILVTPGTLESVADVLGDLAVILRIDGTCTRLGENPRHTDLIATVEEAVRLGVDAVVINVYVGGDHEAALLGKLGHVASECRRLGMVLVAEMIPSALFLEHYGYASASLTAAERAEHIGVAARVGAEIGADVLKLNYSGSPETYADVVGDATRPVLVAGGMRQGTQAEFLAQVKDVLEAGAAGVCAGRNVWGRENMSELLRELADTVHG